MADTAQPAKAYQEHEVTGLFEPSADRGLANYLQRLWEMRHFMLANARGNVAGSTTDYVLGKLWLILEPILTVGVYFILFGIAIRGGNRMPGYDFLSYLVIGRGVFTLFSRSITLSAASMNRNAASSAFDFPQASLPLGKVLVAALRYRYELAATILVILARGESFRMTWLLVPFMSLFAVFMSAGLGLIASRMAARIPDVRNIIATLLRLLYFASGVMLPVESYFTDVRWLKVFTILNPAFALVKIHHWAYLGYDLAPVKTAFASVFIWTVLTFPLGMYWFFRGERSYQAAVILPKKSRKATT